MSVDACAALLASPVNSVAAVQACYNLFPVSPAGVQAQVDALKSYFNFYPYKDIIQHSAAPYYPSSLNLYKELDAITTNAAINTEYKMQNAIMDTLAKLQDGHVFYRPLCFQAYRFYQPFQLTPVFADDGPHYFVDKLSLNATDPIYKFWAKAFAGSKPTDFVGARINTINKQDPTEFLQSFTDANNGIGHAPETRFNTLFPSYNWPRQNTAIFYSFSVQGRARQPTTYEFQFANGDIKEITFDWAAVLKTNPAHLANASQYYQSECIPPPPPQQQAAPAASKKFTAKKLNVDPLRQTVLGSVLPGSSFATPKGSSIVTADENGAFLMLDDKKTGVWAFPGFIPAALQTSPPEQGPQIIADWISGMVNGLLSLEKAGATRLIIDVTNNGGGLVCSGWRMANYLFPKANIKPLLYQSRLTQSLADVMVAEQGLGDYLMAGAFTPNGTKVTDYAKEVLTPGEKIAGYPHMNTNKVIIDNENGGCPAIPQTMQLKKGWLPKNILLVSNGVCGSTCAQFTTYLRDQVGVRVVTYGGGYKRSAGDNNFDPTAFAAGDVLSFATFLDIYGYTGYFYPNAFKAPHKVTMPSQSQDPEDVMFPRPFPFAINEHGQMPFLTSYSPKPAQPNLPIEWIIDPSEFYLNTVNMGDPASVWKAVLDNKLFESSITRA
ncbi:UNVERIFIED_CONTAM: hypothetical protein HDU68_012657 [Siphonaria sp. JEL0065]|nr:hypothetical protein HDU68_012657 [Siphonaria sp. JEL0065]